MTGGGGALRQPAFGDAARLEKLEKLPPSASVAAPATAPADASPPSVSRSSSSVLHARLQEQHTLLLQAQEQARQANAAYADATRTQNRIWRAVQLAAPVLCALVAGLALGDTIAGRATSRGRT